eukprot:scaffold130420_cov31-Tisochrysis_lutea.AAC.3
MEPGLRLGPTRPSGKSVCNACASPPMLRKRAAIGRGGGSLTPSAFARRPATCEGSWVQPATANVVNAKAALGRQREDGRLRTLSARALSAGPFAT